MFILFRCAFPLCVCSYTGAIASESTKGDAPCSAYMSGLEEAVVAANRHQLSGLPEGHVVESARVATAARLITVFMRLAALVRENDGEAVEDEEGVGNGGGSVSIRPVRRIDCVLCRSPPPPPTTTPTNPKSDSSP